MDLLQNLRSRGFVTPPESFYRHIAGWDEWYRGDVAAFHRYTVFTGAGRVRCRRYTMGMAKKVAEDWADLLMNEKVAITLEGPKEQAFFDQVCRDNDFAARMNRMQERKAALGTAACIPRVEGAAAGDGGILTGGRIRLDFCAAGDIIPLRWENGRVLECAFTSRRASRDGRFVYAQIHRLAPDGTYDIENVLFQDREGDLTEVPLDALPAMAGVPALVHTRSQRPQFVIDRLGIVNNIDPDLPMGVSVYANAIDQLKAVDIAYDSYVNEFVLGKKRIIVRPEATVSIDGEPLFDPNDTVYYVLPEDGAGSVVDPVDMSLRAEEHSAGMQDMLNVLATKCGLGEHRYQYEWGAATTATQVISQNSAMFRTVRKHELALEQTLTELAHIILRLGNAYLAAGLDENVPVRVDFDDSIIVDQEAEFNKTLQMLSAGLLRPWEARARLLKEDDATARAAIGG